MSIRAHVSKLTLRLKLPNHGSIETQGRLLPIQVGTSAGRGDGEYKLCTADKVPVNRVYVHGEKRTEVPEKDLRRYVQGNLKNDEPEVKKMLTPEEYEKVKAAKKSKLPKDIVEVTVHSSKVDDQIWPTSDRKSFLLTRSEDDPEHATAYDFLSEIISNPAFTVLTQANIRNSEAFYALQIWNGQIVMQPMIFTDELHPHEGYQRVVDDKTASNAFQVGKALMQEFDADAYANKRLAAIRAVEAGAEDAEVVQDTSNVSDNIMAFLDAQV